MSAGSWRRPERISPPPPLATNSRTIHQGVGTPARKQPQHHRRCQVTFRSKGPYGLRSVGADLLIQVRNTSRNCTHVAGYIIGLEVGRLKTDAPPALGHTPPPITGGVLLTVQVNQPLSDQLPQHLIQRGGQHSVGAETAANTVADV